MTRRLLVAVAFTFALVTPCAPLRAQPAPTKPSASASSSAVKPGPTASASATVTASASATPNASVSAEPAPPDPPEPPPPRPAVTALASAAPSAQPSAAPVAPAPTVAAPPPAPEIAPPAPVVPAAEAPAEVRVGETVAFVLRAKLGDQSAADRAAAASKALKGSLEGAKPEDVHVERTREIAVVYLGSTPIVQLSPLDAQIAGDASLDVHADAIAAQLRKAVTAEKARTALASRIFAISLVVFFGVVVLYLVRKIGEFAERANAWVEDNPHRIPAIRVRSLMLLTPAGFRSGVALTIGVGKWFGQGAIVYVWLLAALGLFETTRGYTDRINNFILQPFVSLTTRIAALLPITVVVAFAGLSVALVLRVVALFFESIREGNTTVEWMPPDLARPSSTLLRIGIVLSTLVFAAPVLTGHDDGALARAGMIGLVTIGLAGTPLVASAIAGVVVVFGRRVRVGDHVRIGDAEGRVSGLGLFDVTLERATAQTRVPHLLTLFRHTEIRADGGRVEARVRVDPARARAALTEGLEANLGEVGDAPRVEVTALSPESVELSLSVRSEAPGARAELLRRVLEWIDGGGAKRGGEEPAGHETRSEAGTSGETVATAADSP